MCTPWWISTCCITLLWWHHSHFTSMCNPLGCYGDDDVYCNLDSLNVDILRLQVLCYMTSGKRFTNYPRTHLGTSRQSLPLPTYRYPRGNPWPGHDFNPVQTINLPPGKYNWTLSPILMSPSPANAPSKIGPIINYYLWFWIPGVTADCVRRRLCPGDTIR